MKKQAKLLAILLFITSSLTAQFSLQGEFRPRFEYRDGYSRLKSENDAAALILSQRTRLTADYKNDWLNSRISFQDVRLWGNDNIVSSTGMFGNNASTAVFEAWTELSFLTHSSVRIGRQVFEYDDSRILSDRNWNNNALSYDALLYKYKHNGWQLDAAFSFNNTKNNMFGNAFSSEDNRIRSMNFLRIFRNLNANLSASVIGIVTGFMKENSSETIYLKTTYGTNLNYKKDVFDIFGSFYYQSGTDKSGMGVSAWNANSTALYSIGNTRFKLGFSLLSGNDSDQKKLNTFDLIYGARHKYYGRMDYFTELSASTKNAGLNNFFAGVSYKISRKTSLSIDYHYFTLNQDLEDFRSPEPNVFFDKALGSEIDLGIIISLGNTVNLQGGYSMMLPTDTFTFFQIGEAENKFSSWGWLMLSVKPDFLTTK
jgi:hypothetical protein